MSNLGPAEYLCTHLTSRAGFARESDVSERFLHASAGDAACTHVRSVRSDVLVYVARLQLRHSTRAVDAHRTEHGAAQAGKRVEGAEPPPRPDQNR
ncbi:hypothetical protein EXIGLDRAFT_717268, partial [Exidia glandulosa HHB12029]